MKIVNCVLSLCRFPFSSVAEEGERDSLTHVHVPVNSRFSCTPHRFLGGLFGVPRRNASGDHLRC